MPRGKWVEGTGENGKEREGMRESLHCPEEKQEEAAGLEKIERPTDQQGSRR